MELLIFRACWYSEVDLFTKSLYLYFVSIRFAYKFLDFMIDVLNYFQLLRVDRFAELVRQD